MKKIDTIAILSILFFSVLVWFLYQNNHPQEIAPQAQTQITSKVDQTKKDWRDNVEIEKQKYNQKFYLDFQKEWAKKCHAKGWFFYRENSKTDSLSGWLAHLPIAYVDYIEIAFGRKKAKPIIDDLNHIGGKRIYFKQYFQHTNRCSTQEPAWLTPDVKAKRAKAQERIEANRAIADNYAKNYGPDFLATFRQDLKRKCNARSWFKYYDHTRTINKSGWHIVLPDLEKLLS